MTKPNRVAGRRQLGSREPSVVPLYHQVYVLLRQRIRDGAYCFDRPLPGEHQLADDFGVSRVTIRRTLNNLELDGFVERRRGVGTFAIAQPAQFHDRYNIGGLMQPGSRGVAPTASKTLRSGLIAAPGHVARDLGTSGSVFRIERLRHIRGEPFTLMTAYLPEQVSQQINHTTLKETPVLVAIEDSGFFLARTEQSITAREADERQAKLLHQPVNSALIFMSSVFSDKENEPVLLLEGLFRPDMYEYRSAMLRRGRGRSARWTPIV